MAETVYSATKVFNSLHGEWVLSVDAGTGSVAVECQHGTDNWVTMETFSADTVQTIEFGRGRIYRFTVTGDATYALG